MYKLKINEFSNKEKYKTLSILIVDDDELSSSYFKKILELRGHNVTTLNEGIRCVSKVNQNKYDLIFMDYHIDDINGDEVTQIIKEDFDNNSVIFAYTGDNSNDAINKFKDCGMEGALIKPIEVDYLNDIMSILEKDLNSIDKNGLNRISRRIRGNLLIF